MSRKPQKKRKLTNWKKGDPHQAHRRGKANAKRRGHAWALEEDDFLRLFKQPCHYCGLNFSRGWGTGLDQKIPGGGYTILNVVPCCGPCNTFKSDRYTYAEMLEIGKVLGPLLKKLAKRRRSQT